MNSFVKNAVVWALTGTASFQALPVWADAKDYYIRHKLAAEALQTLELSSETNASTSGTFDQKIDTLDLSETRTFKQRFFYDGSFAEGPNSPVIYVICGEGSCGAQDLGGAVAVHARQLKAHRIALEHRYYGSSQPFSSLTTENLKYLTVRHALADLARFQEFAKTKFSLKGQWIAVGGSYSGALAAYYRSKYPNNVVGALASSGPVQAKANFEEYDRHVAHVAGDACAQSMRATVAKIEDTMKTPDGVAQMKELFGASGVINDVDFLYVVADMAAFAVQYGFRDDFCNGLAHGGNVVSAYAEIGKNILQRFGLSAVEDSFQGAESLDPKTYESGVGLRAWLYQSCTEFGFYQTAYHDAQVSVRSAKITKSYHDEACRRLFGEQMVPVNDGATNDFFYAPLLRPEVSHIFFTNGSEDPWSNLSITLERGNGQSNINIELRTLAGAAHCDDLASSGSQSVASAQARFRELAALWLHVAE